MNLIKLKEKKFKIKLTCIILFYLKKPFSQNSFGYILLPSRKRYQKFCKVE